jgi:hypothetical protein
MGITEIRKLQIGNQIVFANGSIAEIKSISNANKSATLFMLGGEIANGLLDQEIPPEKKNAETIVICDLADLISAEITETDPHAFDKAKLSEEARRHRDSLLYRSP